jgi:hypothetical protein
VWFSAVGDGNTTRRAGASPGAMNDREAINVTIDR